MASKQLIFDRDHISLDYENQCLIIREPPHGMRSLPLRYIRRIVCVHGVTLTTHLLGQLWQHKIDFVALNPRDVENSFGIYPNQQQQVQRRCIQYQWQQDSAQALSLAQRLCQHRIHTQIRLLARIQQQQPDTNLRPLLQQLRQLRQHIASAGSTDQLRGMEGSAQRLMFEFWRSRLPANIGFQQRQRRPPPDPINALLSLTYTLAMQEAIRQCKAEGLDSQLGFYHRVAHGRHSLACDLMETVRPHCEQWVVELINRGTINLRHFSFPKRGGGCRLGKAGRIIYYQQVAHAMSQWRRHLAAAARWIRWQIDRNNAPEEAVYA